MVGLYICFVYYREESLLRIVKEFVYVNGPSAGSQLPRREFPKCNPLLESSEEVANLNRTAGPRSRPQ